MYFEFFVVVNYRVAIYLEILEKSGNSSLVGEKSGKLGKVRETVVCLCYGTAVAIVTK